MADTLSKFRDIQAQLSECKAAADLATDERSKKQVASRHRNLQNTLRHVKSRLAQSVADTLCLARAQLDAGEHEAARVLFQQVLECNPTTKSAADLEPLLGHGECCLRCGALAEALADGQLLVRNWPQCAACFYLRGRVHFEMACKDAIDGAAEQAVADLEQTLTLLNHRREDEKDIDFGGVRIWLQRVQNSVFALARQRHSTCATSRVRTQRSVLTTLCGNLLRHVFTFCTHVELCRLELVCNEWTSMLMAYRRFLWKPLYQKLRSCDGDRIVDARCPKALFAKRYRPWIDCANCGERYNPLNNAGGCKENCYHPGQYGERRRFEWSCCKRLDSMRRVMSVSQRDGSHHDQARRLKSAETQADAHIQKRHDAWPAHLGSGIQFDQNYALAVPCSRGCTKGPHSEEQGHFFVESRQFDPQEHARTVVTDVCCPTCGRPGASSQDKRDECWQDFVDKYASVRQFIRSGRCQGIVWWERGHKKRMCEWA